jgi:hypothetical protein
LQAGDENLDKQQCYKQFESVGLYRGGVASARHTELSDYSIETWHNTSLPL